MALTKHGDQRAARLTLPSADGRPALARHQEAPQPSNCPKQMDAHGRFIQARHGAHLPRRLSIEMTQHEHHSLPFGQLRNRRHQLLAPLARPAPAPRDSVPARACTRPDRARTPFGSSAGGAIHRSRRRRALSRSRHPLIRMRVNQTSNGQFLPKRAQVHVRLDEGILHGFVGVGRIAQVVQRDPHRPPLIPADHLGIPLAGRVKSPGRLQRPDVDGHTGVGLAGSSRAPRHALP